MSAYSSPDNLTFRERLKVACLDAAVSAGLTEDQMIEVFASGAAEIRRSGVDGLVREASMCKDAGWPALLAGLAAAGLIGIPLASALAGRYTGAAAGDIYHGQVPTGDEFRLTDEIALYDKNSREILDRLKDKKEKDARRSKPSVRRMF
jgi:hypothetical protein